MSMRHVATGAVVAEILSHSKATDWFRFVKIAILGALPFLILGLLNGNVVGWSMLWFFICWPIFAWIVMTPGEQVLAMKVQERLKPGSTDLAYYKPMPRVDRTTAAGEFKWICWMIGESDVVSLFRETTDAMYAAIDNPAMHPYIPVLFEEYVAQAAKTGEAHDMWQHEIEGYVRSLAARREEVGA